MGASALVPSAVVALDEAGSGSQLAVRLGMDSIPAGAQEAPAQLVACYAAQARAQQRLACQ